MNSVAYFTYIIKFSDLKLVSLMAYTYNMQGWQNGTRHRPPSARPRDSSTAPQQLSLGLHLNPISIIMIIYDYILWMWLKVECELKKNSLNNLIWHLSWFKKHPPTHTHPLISIWEFSKPYELLFLEFELLVKWKCELWNKSLNNFICYLLFLKKLSPNHTHSPYPFMNFWNPTSFYFLSLSHS